MLRVGLTGGIGAGKSEVSRRLAEAGAVLVDADKIAREVVEPGTEGLAAVVAEFGDGVLNPDGSLNRERLGEIVFADAERRTALNAIVHPLVGKRSLELFEAAPDDAIVVYDVPLLAEGNRTGDFDLVVVVDAAEDVQVRRLVGDRGLTEEQARARIAAQATRDQRRAIADVVIDNSGDLAALERQVEELWKTLKARQ